MKNFPAGILVIAALLALSCARSTVLLRGREAEEYLAAEDRLSDPGDYTLLVLRNRQTSVLMAAVFNRDRGDQHGGNFEVIRREKSMGYHSADNPFTALLLNSPSGKRGPGPEAEIIEEINRSRLTPTVVLDADGEEAAVVFQPGGERLAAFIRPEGTLRLELGERRRGEGDIRYSLELDRVLTSASEKPPAREAEKEEKMTRDIKAGDLVEWETGARTRVGVVRKIEAGGTAVINVPTTEGSREEKIKVERLRLITSTVESE